MCLTSSPDRGGGFQPRSHRRRRGRQTFTTYNKPVRNMQVCGWAKKAGQEGCEKSRPTPVLYRRTFQHGTSCYSNYGIMALLDVATGVIFNVDAFSTSDIFLQLRITPLYFSPVSVHNTLHPPRSISLLFQYKILYIPQALFLSCFSTHHSISQTLCFSPLSLDDNVYHPALFLFCFSTQHCISPPLYFSPV